MSPKDEVPNSVPDLNQRVLSDMGWEERLEEARLRRKEALREREFDAPAQSPGRDSERDAPPAGSSAASSSQNNPNLVWHERLAQARMHRRAVLQSDAKADGRPQDARGGAEIAGDLFPGKKAAPQVGASPKTGHGHDGEVFTTPKSGDGADLKQRKRTSPAEVTPLPGQTVVPAFQPAAIPRPSETGSRSPSQSATSKLEPPNIQPPKTQPPKTQPPKIQPLQVESPQAAPQIPDPRPARRRVGAIAAAIPACLAVAAALMAAPSWLSPVWNPPVAPSVVEVTPRAPAGPAVPVADVPALARSAQQSGLGITSILPTALAAPSVDPTPMSLASTTVPALAPGIAVAPDLPLFEGPLDPGPTDFGPIEVAWLGTSPSVVMPPVQNPPVAAAPLVPTELLTLPGVSALETGPGNPVVATFLATQEFTVGPRLPSPAVEADTRPRDHQMVERSAIWTDLPALTQPRSFAETGFGELTALAPVLPGQRPDLVERIADAAPFLVQQTVPALSAADRLRGRILVRLREGAGN